MPTWRQVQGTLVPGKDLGWEGIIQCNNACVVRQDIDLESPLVDELRPGTLVVVVEDGISGGRQRYRITKPCDGWVTAKFVRRSEELTSMSEWHPLGVPSFFPAADATLTDKTPMGRPPDLFNGDASVDLSFGSPAAMYRDKVEMALWMARRVASFSSSLGDEVKAILLSGSEPPVPTVEPVNGRYPLKVIYIAGVEGTGHHGVMPMLLYPAIREYGHGVLAWWRSLREVLMKTPPPQRKQRLQTILDKMGVFDKPHIIMEWCSYPFGEDVRSRWAEGCADPLGLTREERSGNPGNSVDLKEFVELFQDFADVKVLVLHRSLVSSAWSHKEWDAGLVEHARVLALFSEYLTNVLRGLDPKMWQWIAYEDLCGAHRLEKFEDVCVIAEFVGLQGPALERAFKHFRPSRKDAAKEMSAANLKAIRHLEDQRSHSWFPSIFPSHQLLPGLGQVADSLPAVPSKEPRPAGEENVQINPKTNQHFHRLWSSMNPEQRQAWQELCDASGDPTTAAAAGEKLKQLLSEDQRFLLHKAFLVERVGERTNSADVDPSAYLCLHMWIEDRGFGSEVNNLISAAIYCEQFGLACIVEDKEWNSGRLHSYLQAEPLILRKCPHGSQCRPLEVRRDRQVATIGWFAICKHAKTVSFAEKTKRMRKVWRLTPSTETKITELNSELDLPSDYVAVQIRRGDKVAGNRKESLQITADDYAKTVLEYLPPHGGVVAVCTDDLSAAEEVGTLLERSGVDVRWRRRSQVPSELQRGHWQAAYNALSLEQRHEMTYEFLADVEVMRRAKVCVCTHSSNVGRLVALLRDGPTKSLDYAWTND